MRLFLFTVISILIAGYLSPAFALDAKSQAAQQTEVESLQDQIVTSFEADDCKSVLDLYQKHKTLPFAPIAIAVIGYCAPNLPDEEALFARAEHAKPKNQVIMALHALALRKLEIEKSKNVWRDVRLFARNDSFRRMADDYLSEVVEDINDDKAAELFHRGTSIWMTAKAGPTYESNPGSATLGGPDTPGSSFGNSQSLLTELRNDTSWGSDGANLTLTADNYLSSHFNDRYLSRLDIPFLFDAGTYSIIGISPYYSYSWLENIPYQAAGGLSLIGLSFREDYQQAVQGIIYKDKFFATAARPQGGSHFRFEYNWLFYPSIFQYSFNFSFEHVLSSSDSDSTTSISYTHNDIGVTGFVAAKLPLFEVVLAPSFINRQDTNVSVYADSLGHIINKRRVDYTLEVNALVGIPLERNWKLNVYYDYTRTLSNFRQSDYQNYNTQNRTIGANVEWRVQAL